MSAEAIEQRNGLNRDGREGRKWFAEIVRTYKGTISDIVSHIPGFERRPFTIDALAGSQQMDLFASPGSSRDNRYYDLIIRKPLGQGEIEIPVGIVSKRYTLLQHQDVLASAVEALKNAKICLRDVLTELTITEYGGRMALFLQLPNEFEFDPGDGHRMALKLLCFNSVDRSTPLRIMLGWFRFVCSNGLVFGTAQLSLKRMHNKSLDFPNVRQILCRGLERVAEDQEAFKKWLDRYVDEDLLIKWVDGPLSRQWGVLAAARTYHIAQTGYDGIVVNRSEKVPPHRKIMDRGEEVPGITAPADNAFAISQILAWLAHQRRDIQEQLERMEEIPALMRALLKRQ